MEKTRRSLLNQLHGMVAIDPVTKRSRCTVAIERARGSVTVPVYNRLCSLVVNGQRYGVLVSSALHLQFQAWRYEGRGQAWVEDL